jgi:serine protease
MKMSCRNALRAALAAGLLAAASLAGAMPAEWLVKLRQPEQAAAWRAAQFGLQGPMRAVGGGWFAVRPADAGPSGAGAAATQLRAQRAVLHVMRPVRERLTAVPNDSLYASQQWWLGAWAEGSAGVPGMPAAWDRSTGAPVSGLAPVVAVLDSGYTNHPELDAKWLGQGHDFVSQVAYSNDGDGRDADARDPGDRLTAAEAAADPATWDGCETREAASWHGTMMAGQVGATSNNGAGVAGLHWAMDARILPVRVAGRCGASVADVVDGLRWAAGLHVDGVPDNPARASVIVLGVAGFASCDANDPDPDVAAAAQLYIDTLAAVRAQGTLVVAAAGNQRRAVGRPAACPGALAVTSINQQGFKALYANFGPQVALATVGGDAAAGRDCDSLLADTGIVTTSNLGGTAPTQFGYAAGSGTSFAAPVVAGVAALMWSINPSLTPEQIEQGLRASARPHVRVPALTACSAKGNFGRCQCDTTNCGAGIVDASEALAFAAAPVDYAAPVRPSITLDTEPVRQCAALLGLLPQEPPPEPPPEPPVAGSGSGGGALAPGWALGLLLACVALRASARRDARGQPLS